jgi:hypothetical protein
VVCDILQRHLDSLFTYFKQWKIKINAVKTQAIYFTRCWSPRILPTTHIRVGGHPIPWSTEVKYLEATLDKRLTIAGHTARSIEKSVKAFLILYIHFSIGRRSLMCIINYYFTKSAFVRFYVMGSSLYWKLIIHSKLMFKPTES